MTLRAARADDIRAIADLHATRIDEGFLTSLGTPFLRRLYGRVLHSHDAFIVVDDLDGVTTGFVAGVADLGALYRRFIVRDGLLAGFQAAPRLVKNLPRVVETLRYPAITGDLPEAEVLAVAVAADRSGHGVGQALVRAVIEGFVDHGIRTAKVVTTADNLAALAMYHACGFVAADGLEVHAGRSSEVLVWTA
jgi:ribosomal protein S18 acetylase RimI-like enzyme